MQVSRNAHKLQHVQQP